MLYTHATIITVNTTRDVITDGALLIHSNKIPAMGKTTDLLCQHPDEPTTDLTNRTIILKGSSLTCRVSEALYKEMTAISREKNIPIRMHCAEAPADGTFFASQNHTPRSYCSSVELLGPQTVLVHMVHLDDSDIAKLAETGTHVVHCPSSNTKLASGICQVPQLLQAGVNVSLGTDGAPCNNTCDMLQEMRLAGILHQVSMMDPTAVPAETVLEMATINGAQALGLGSEIGSLEVGKKADFAVINTAKVELQPWFSAVSAVVYAATGRDVEMVVVDGRVAVEKGTLLTMDEEAIWREAARRAKEVVERAGLAKEVEARWNVV